MEILLCGNMPTPPYGLLGGSTSQGLLVQRFESATNHSTARILFSRISHSHELNRREKGCQVSISLEGNTLPMSPSARRGGVAPDSHTSFGTSMQH